MAVGAVTKATLPDQALLRSYADRPDCYTDCFSASVPRQVSLSQLITGFYSTPLFGLERLILKWIAKRPSTHQDIDDLAQARTDRFAAWNVEARSSDQILLCDMSGRTRSWLMVSPEAEESTVYFGSAVTPPAGKTDLGFGFTALLGFHKLYSKALLWSAVRRL